MGKVNDQKRAVSELVERLWNDWSLEPTRGQHLRVTLRDGPRSRAVFVSGTPGDHRALKNIERDVRRAVRELKDLRT